MDSVDVLCLYDRLRKTHWPRLVLPWERHGVQILAIDDWLVGWTVCRDGRPRHVAIMPGYVWDPGREYLPGGELFEMLQRRPPEELAKLGSSTVQITEEDQKKYPTLSAHLTQRTWEDGTAREVSKLNLWHDGGVYKIMIRDVAQGLVCFVAAPSLSKLLPTLEAALTSPGTDWRPDKAEQFAKRRKK